MDTHDAPSRTQADQRIDEAIERLRSSGHRRTHLRLAVLTALAGGAGHLSAESVQRSIEQNGAHVHLSAVYRALTELSRCGAACTAPTPGGHVFGLARPTHHHAVCVSCGSVTAVLSDVLEAAVAEIEAVSGLAVRGDGLYIRGRCTQCVGR